MNDMLHSHYLWALEPFPAEMCTREHGVVISEAGIMSRLKLYLPVKSLVGATPITVPIATRAARSTQMVAMGSFMVRLLD